MKIEQINYEKLGHTLINLVRAVDRAGHKRVKSSADHDVNPTSEHLEAQFIVDVFTKTTPEIMKKWFE